MGFHMRMDPVLKERLQYLLSALDYKSNHNTAPDKKNKKNFSSPAFYGVIFPGESEAAFSNYRLWESLGYIFTYVGSSTTCLGVKLSNVLVSLIFGIIGYYVIEVLERRGGLKKDENGQVVPFDILVKEKLFGSKKQ